jgi:serine/threonine protein kinase/WD40 repeat protein
MPNPGEEPVPGYRLEQMLGRGQYGEVWKATTPGRSTIALKFLDLTGRQGRKEFRSAQRVKQIRHAHLMPVVAIWFLDKDGLLLTDDAMESISDEESASAKTIAIGAVSDSHPPARMIIATPLGDISLRDRLAECVATGKPGIPVGELIDYMHEAAKGIDYLNSEQHDWRGSHVGVQHCDIKPDNIMLVGGSVVICDFGVAQVLADYGGGIRATSLSGSPAYMAPEAFEAKPCRTSDQYSLAVTYYELRTGELPLHGDSFAAVYEAHRYGKLDFSLVPPAEQAVLRRATNPDPAKRFASSGDFVQALDEATNVGKRGKGLPDWFAKALLATLAACVFAGLGIWYSQSRPVELALTFNTPNAKVQIGDEEYVADESGKLTVKVPQNVPVEIAAIGNEGRTDAKWTIQPSEFTKKKQFEFSIPYTAAHHAAEATRLIATGQFEKAIDAYVLAIQAEPDHYARLPEPAILEMPPILWGDCLQVTPKGDALIAGGKDGVVRRWSIIAGGIDSKSTDLYSHDGAQITNVIASDKLIASVCDLGAIWVMQEHQAEQLQEGDGMDVDLALSQDERALVAAISASLASKVVAWDASASEIKSTRHELGEQPGEFPRLIGAAGDAVVLATKDQDALVWQWKVGESAHGELGRQQNEILCLTAAADGRRIAYAGVANSGTDGPEAAIVDITSHTAFPLASRQSDSILACALDDEGRLLATAERSSGFSDAGAVILWRPNTASGIASTERALEYGKNLGDVGALVISREVKWIAAGHEKGGVTLWYVADNKAAPFMTFGAGDRVVALRITPDQRWLISGARDGRTLIFDLHRLEVLHRAFQRTKVTPKIGEDKVTLRGRPARRGFHSPWANGETVFRLPGRPTA